MTASNWISPPRFIQGSTHTASKTIAVLRPVTALGPTLTAPTASLSSATSTEVDLSATVSAGGSGNYTYQWYRGTSAGFVPSPSTLLAGANGLTLADTSGLAPDVPYFYLLGASDGTSTVYSNQVIGALSIPTLPITIPYQVGPVLLASIGSSTWAINQGSGQVPTLIDSDLRSQFPGVNFTTFNGAVSGTTTSNFLPGQPFNNAVKTAVMNFNGYKVLRLMIGSNDAAGGRPVSAWLANMQTIIQDALTWPVDLIVLDEIGVRLDGGNATLDLIRQYNAARSSLLGPKVVLGTAYTFENQALNLSQLSGDNIHQNNAGQIVLAANQATEVSSLFTAPTTFNFTQDNAAYFVSVDSSQSFIQISPGSSSGAGPLFNYPLATAPALDFNLLGQNVSLTFDFANGSPIPAGGIEITSDHSYDDKVLVAGQNPSQNFVLTDYELSTGNRAISYNNLSGLQLSRGIFNYSGGLTTLDDLVVGAQAIFYWS